MNEKAYRTQLRKLHFACRAAKRTLPAHLSPFFALTDPRRTPDPVAYARELPKGGGIIFRHFGNIDALEIALALLRVARKKHLRLLIGNDPHLAMTIGADGVHWPEARLGEAKFWRGRFKQQTVAAHSRQAIKRAQEAGIDAALLSTVFTSNSPSAGPPIGAYSFRHLAQANQLPLYALGGIKPENMLKVTTAGGIAGIDFFSGLSG